MKPVFHNKHRSFPFLTPFLVGLCCLAILLTAEPVVALPPLVSTPTTYYVRTETQGNGDGLSWANASSDLAKILNNVVVSGNEIWVAEGAYKPQLDKDGNVNLEDPRTKTFALQSGVSLYGGFEDSVDVNPDFADRDPGTYITILTGDIDHNDVIADDGTITGNDGNSNNVLYADHIDLTAIVDGFTVTAGKVSNDGGTS